MTIDTVIFDMDGVVTTEEKYWACVRLTLWELVTQTLGLSNAFGDAVHDPAAREAVVPDSDIYALKSLAVNSNWDITYLVACVYLAALPGATVLTAPGVPELLEAIQEAVSGPAEWPAALTAFLQRTGGAKGRVLIREAGTRLQSALDLSQSHLLQVDGPLWWYLHERFQRWYRGEAMAERDAPPLLDGTVIPAEQLHAMFKQLQAENYTLGAATGRPRDELEDALGDLGLLEYFDKARLGTLDVVRQAETKFGVSGLSKPHPFSLLRALYPHADFEVLLDEDFQKLKRPNVAVIGDSTSDVLMAKAAGCRPVGVLTGVRGQSAQVERYRLLMHSGCEAILDDVTHLPDWLEGLPED
ncbi:MAG: HAD family hydrolase [Aggregatilineales bacterium]